jgi:hypothetical protein
VSDGHVSISDAPGWGVEINPAWLEKATVRESSLESWKSSAYAQLYVKEAVDRLQK